MRSAYKILIAVAAMLLFLGNPAHATHYRYGNISWNRVNDASRTVTFTVTTAWRITYFGSPTPVVGSVVNPNVTFRYGDGATIPLSVTVTSVNTTEDWLVGTTTLTHTYAAGPTAFTASFDGCCRFSSLENNFDLSFRSESVIQFVAGNLSSPVSTLPAIINLPINQAAASFNVPAFDPDGTALTYGLAAPVQVSQPATALSTNPAGLAINPTSGAATFNTTGKTIGDLWNGFFVITDATGSTTIVDFIMKMVAPNSPPIFNYSITPSNNHFYSINPGQNLAFSIQALCPDPGSTVTLTAVGLPTNNYTFSPALPTVGNPVTSAFSFTPAFSQLGNYVLTFTATRNGGVQTSTSVIINVNTNPIFIAPSPTAGSTYLIPTNELHQDDIVATNPDPTVNTRINSASIPGGASLSPAVPTAFATTPGTTLSWTPAPADFGPNTLTFVAVDANGRTASHSYILWPNTMPEFTSAPVISGVECAPYSYSITVSDPDVPYGDVLEIRAFDPLPAWLTLTDNGDGTGTLSGTPPPGSAGSYSISLIAEDTWHHAHPDVLQSYTLTVGADATAPVPDVAVLPAVTGECSVSLTSTPTATDNCYGAVTGVTADPTSYSVVGTYTITWTYDDGHGNTSTQTQTVTVTDTQAPVLSGVPADVTVQCNTIPGMAIVSSLDNCEGSLPVSSWEGPSIPTKLSHVWNGNGDYLDAIGSANGTPVGAVSFGTPILGTNSFSFNGTPGYINCGTAGSVSGTGNFAVSAWVRTTSTAPMVIVQQRDANFVGEYLLKIGGNHCNCDLRPGKLYFLVYGSGSPVVDLWSTINVNDGKWHHVMAERNGTAIRLYIDGALAATGSTGVVVSMGGTLKTIIGRDIRDNNSTFNGLIDDVRVWTAADCPSTYEFDRNWMTVDGSMNQSAAVQHIKVEDNDAPMLISTLPAGSAGMNLCFSAAPAGPSASDIAALYSDNCGTVHATKSGSVTGNNDSWSVTYTYDVFDDCGHHVAPSPTIAYNGGDQSAPVPDVTALPTVTGECSAEVTSVPMATDNCEGIVIGTTTDPLSYTTQGTHTITWTYDDGNGNISTQTQAVIVNDVTPPVASCKSFTLNLSGGVGTVTAQDINNGSSDNCGIASMSVSPSSFTCSNAGQRTVTLTVTDINGNTSTCNATVTVQYQPTCSITAIPSSGAYTGGPATTIYLGYGPQSVTLSSSVTGGSGFTYSWSGLSPQSTALLSCTGCASPVFSPTSEGRYKYTLTATNSNGCSTTCQITICVLDVRVPGTNGNKVYLCHVPPGNPGNPQTLSISVNAVPAHIPAHVGDHLGQCSQSCDNLVIKSSEEIGELITTPNTSFETVVYPNPFSSDFTVTVETESVEPVSMIIYDLTGKMMMEVKEIQPNAPFKVNNNLSNGFYLLQVRQGTEVQNIKIIKQR